MMLNEVEGVYCAEPQGATFVFPRYDTSLSSTDLSELLVQEEGVVVTPGIGFGVSGENHFRIALMRSPAPRVIEGTEKIVRLLSKL
jgi:aspartate/methionine/tyrosine aminotransferase